ncbi:hypothetical protein Kfla_1980 [Kribbella flavida DSM 17836]|uniref:DUF3995 domain-containing protein n=1 Tax=Kribbella flavida (strain DSM 17836 / JCM 10339 / NBRC 14399) TaxID=479435 RepID=D2PQT9_KRIFD|nr:hypothetical protein [Kribbella flavida]ADB31072.1 hypothetical protein Kfla_1980 [Kribbella flavida DSM 17836]
MTQWSNLTTSWWWAVAGWSFCYLVLGVNWALGGPGYPLEDAYAARTSGAVLVGPPSEAMGVVIACLAGAVLAAALTAVPSARSRWQPRFGLVVAVLLVLTVPDARLLVALINLPIGNTSRVSDAVLHQVWVLLGALLLWRAAAPRRSPRSLPAADSNWRPMGWQRRIWIAAVVLPLVYAARQLAWAAGVYVGVTDEFIEPYTAPGARLTELVLAAATILGAVLTTGLGRRWGSQAPRWIPLVGGREIPVLLAVIPGMVIAVILSAAGLSIYRGLLAMALGLTPVEPSAAMENWAVWLPTLCWLPWGITLGLATADYRRRRIGTKRDPASRTPAAGRDFRGSP